MQFAGISGPLQNRFGRFLGNRISRVLYGRYQFIIHHVDSFNPGIIAVFPIENPDWIDNWFILFAFLLEFLIDVFAITAEIRGIIVECHLFKNLNLLLKIVFPNGELPVNITAIKISLRHRAGCRQDGIKIIERAFIARRAGAHLNLRLAEQGTRWFHRGSSAGINRPGEGAQ